MTNQQGAPEALRPIARYKIGYATDDWGMRSSTPSGIPDAAGAWVRYDDHAAQVAALTAAPQGGAYAELPGPDLESTQCDSTMRYTTLRSFTADQMRDFADRTHALRASHGQAPAGAAPSAEAVLAAPTAQPAPAATPDPQAAEAERYNLMGLLAECRDAFPLPEIDSPLENQWMAAMGDPAEVPGYLRLVSEAMQDRANLLASELAAARAPADSVTAPATESYVQTVPYKCDRIVWRGRYYHLPPAQAADSVLEDAAPWIDLTGCIRNDAAQDGSQAKGMRWAASRWKDEVENRPLSNIHRRTLDDVWRQVVRYFGGIPSALLGPSHDELLDAARKQGANHD